MSTPVLQDGGRDAQAPRTKARTMDAIHRRIDDEIRFGQPDDGTTVWPGMPCWRSMESAPKDGTRILMADDRDIETGQWVKAMSFPNTRSVYPAGWEDDRYDAAHRFEPQGSQPTHWMLLPQPPQ